MTDFSIVTVTLNSASTVRDCVRSVKCQEGVDVEHILKDGLSCDDTVSQARLENPGLRVLEKRDKGIYDAMNQGFREASGDFVAFLNSDDYYASDDVLRKVRRAFRASGADIVYGDVQIVNDIGRAIRFWRSGAIHGGSLGARQLPHPAIFVRRSALEELDEPFDASYFSAADYKQQLLLIEKMECRASYIEAVLTIMRAGGASNSSFAALRRGWIESARAYREVHGRWGGHVVVKKVLSKLPQVLLARGVPSN